MEKEDMFESMGIQRLSNGRAEFPAYPTSGKIIIRSYRQKRTNLYRVSQVLMCVSL
jgi:hypothetical protein